MAGTQKRHRGTKSSWLFQFLSPLYRRIRIYRETTTQTHMEGTRMALGTGRTKSFRGTKETRKLGTGTGARETRRPVRTRGRCLRICGRRCTRTAKRGWYKQPYWTLLGNT